MVRSHKPVISRFAYGAIFLIAVPVLLYVWATTTASVIPLPAPHSAFAGSVIFGVGLVLIASAWITLIMRARGLPMNAFPPKHFVRSLVYRYLAHPIYVGFALCCLGASIYFGSASGFWLVTPLLCLAMTALVWGYEANATRVHFGAAADQRPLIALPEDSNAWPSGWQRLSVHLLVLVPWLIIYELFEWLGATPDAVQSFLPFEHSWPVVQWTFAVYATPYVVVPLLPLFLRTRHELREFALLGNIATLVIAILYITIPLVAPPRPFIPTSWLGQLLATDRLAANTVASFPSFHVVWTMIAAHFIGQTFPRLKATAWLWAMAVASSCITTGMHSLADIAFAALSYYALAHWRSCWEFLRRSAERTANSWHEWRIGRVRLINHGLYAGLGAGLGTYIACAVSGAPVWSVVFVGVCTVGGAGLWAQALEGSSVLLRPFGYYGAIVGCLLSTLILSFWRADALFILAGYALGAPWVQICGRMRCLVQGCCHGRQAPPHIGICYAHPRSRVRHVDGLAGTPIHPTPLYSILSNVVIGLLLARLCSVHAAPVLIGGLYLMFNAISRFVEESYRGEPQTPIVLGLRVYQWTAVISFVIGMFITALPSSPAPEVRLFDTSYLFAGLLLFVIVSAAMGLDFPNSNARFSRLASADLLPSRN